MSGACLGVVSLLFGLTVVAGAGNVGPRGAVGAVLAIPVSTAGFYLLCTGLWAGWTPAASVRTRTRSVRAALTWAIVVALYMFLSLPLLSPATMGRREWVSALTLLALLTVSIGGIVAINRHPRLVTGLLALSGVYALFVLLKLIGALIGPGSPPAVGPAIALSFLLAGSMCVALISASLLAWPLRSASDARAI